MKKSSSAADWHPYHLWDINPCGLLPRNWKGQISDVLQNFGYLTVLSGDGSTSREERTGQRMVVRVVEGTHIENQLPWLWELYRGPLRSFAENAFHCKLFPSVEKKSSVNINQIAGVGSRYEWHVDSNPVTGLLFASTCNAKQGGALIFKDSNNKRSSIVWPRAGVFICFDARDIPHAVSPLRVNTTRITVPMNYYVSETDQMRPEDLDIQLYTPTALSDGDEESKTKGAERL